MPHISVWILGDQLLAAHPALAAAEALTDRANIRVVLVESAQRLARLPYQRKKLVLLLSAMRHYAEELRKAGFTVEYVRAATAGEGLRRHVAAWQPERLLTMAAAEYGGRRFQQERLAGLLGVPVDLLPNTQFLSGRHDPYPQPDKRVILENFYRSLRRHWKLLIDDAGAPVGGAWNFDQENRKPLP
ncbi:MAG: cryptochrome/photolyase family protein, partial [Caldilineaceae bacterium]|nr:cryptochrome/photolyase family protein [Caldilineaceae bacterium]